MKFNVSAEMEYNASASGTLIFNIHALRTVHQAVISETFTIDPYIKVEELANTQGENRLIRFEITQPSYLKVNYTATADNFCEIKDFANVEQIPVGQMDLAVLPYLYPSRYCQSDELYAMAGNLFGHIQNPFQKVSAVTDWINKNVTYLSGATNSQTSAYDTVNQKAGVCRDFAHLGIAFCRALTIPARYFAGYAYQLQPPDFHACFEAYIGDQWLLFDATRLVPLNGLVKIASGRDAADTAVANIFGNITFASMKVSCELADVDFNPFYFDPNSSMGLSYL